jgi:glycosyltransferase involved in cell wall biosynthesis
VLNLAELVALRPDIASIRKVLYFHENQLVYPVRKQQDRDFQYGYNQIISCLTADIVLFNSKFNQESFLSSIDGFLKVMPDYRPRGLADQIRSKCKVLYYPLHIDLPPLKVTETTLDSSCSYKDKSSATSETVSSSAFMDSQLPLHILWPHRWEHDKDPDTFFSVLFDLKEAGCQFVVSVLGQVFNEVPEVFEIARQKLDKHILNWGYQETRESYLKVLQSGDVVVSTAVHEFYGVAM